jgi:aminoglycoside 6'-N-acetyltransferase
MTPVLRGARVVLRPAEAADATALAPILRDPAVARWFGAGDPEEIAREWVDADDAAPFVIEIAGETIGSVQYYEETDPDYRHAGMDIFVMPARHGKGYGPETLAVLARHLFEDIGHHRLVIDPASANGRAIRAYERVGFRRVGLMRSYERGADGAWHDNVLMDMLAGELLDPSPSPAPRA